MNPNAAVKLSGIRKTFDGEDYVLDGVDLEIERGKITVLIGFSGTGKSVLLKHILGLLSPTEGEVRVLGRRINGLPYRELTSFRRNFGVLFQNAALFDDMTTLENVCFPLVEHEKGRLTRGEILNIASRKLAEVGLDKKHYDKLPSQLSGGMRKRVGLARAIALDPDILLYDEPTTGLDPVMTEMVDDLIVSTHNLRKGLTSVIVTHDLSAGFRIGDYVAMLDSGKIILYGTPEDFMGSDIPLIKKFVEKGVYRR